MVPSAEERKASRENDSISPLTSPPPGSTPTAGGLQNNENQSIDEDEASISSSNEMQLTYYSPRNSYSGSSGFGEQGMDERQPLLVIRSNESMDERAKELFSYENNKTIIYIMLALLALLFLFYLTYQQLDSLVLQAIETSFESLSIMDLNHDGVDCHVRGTVSMHYGSIGNHFYRFFMKFASVILGSVIVTPNGPVKLFAGTQDMKMLHVLNIYPPDIQVDMANNAITEIDFISKTELIKENVVSLINRLELLTGSSEVVEIMGSFDSIIETKMFKYSTSNARFYSDYELSREDLAPLVRFSNLSVTEKDHELDFHSTITVENEFPVRAKLDAINWDVTISDCNNELVKLGEWQSTKLSVEPDNPVLFGIDGKMWEIPQALLQDCENNITIINKLMQDYLQSIPIEMYIRATNNKHNQQTLPPWLLYILNKVNYKLSVGLPDIRNDLDGYVQGYDVKSLFLEVVPSSAKDRFNCLISTNVSATANVPKGVDITLGVPKFQNSIMLFEKGEVVVNGWSNTNNHMQIRKGGREADVTIDSFEVETVAPAHMGRLVNRLLNYRNANESLALEITFDELKLVLPILATTLKHLQLPNLPVLMRPMPDNALAGVVAGLNITIYSIVYVDSGYDDLHLRVKCQMHNPTGVAIEVPGDTITMHMGCNDTVLGEVSTHNLVIPDDPGAFNFTFDVRLNPGTTRAKLVLEQLIGQFVSGYDDLVVSVSGGDHGSENPGLATFLKQISVEDVAVPNISFATPGTWVQKAHASPFVVDATIHILTSELELTLFNPVANADLMVHVYQAEAFHDGTLLAHIVPNQEFGVPPGVHTTPRLAIAMDSGLGMDILRRALNGRLEVQVVGAFHLTVGQFDLQLLYEGSGMNAAIRL